jgi:hypothetical protein
MRCLPFPRVRRWLLPMAALLFAPASSALDGGPAAPTVLLLSLDGTRPVDVAELPAFRRLAEQGAVAEALEPVFPSNTFPNHVTLVTGVEPDEHGIVNNVFRDEQRGVYRYDDDPSWLEVEPLWSLLSRSGIPTASYHWVGSEGPWRNGRGPRHWERFDSDVPAEHKVTRILEWLDLAAAEERPRFITAWLHGADGTGHRHGPGTPESIAALRKQEAALAGLLAGLDARGLRASTTLLVVSDHGMARVERHVDLEAALGGAGIRADVIGGGGFATIRLARGRGQRAAAERRAAVARAAETARELGLEAWPRGESPARFPTSNPRYGDLVAMAPVGTAIVDGSRSLAAPAAALGLGLRGAHGHRPDADDMAGIFYALGRGVEPGFRPGRVRALDVAPTVLQLLGQPRPAHMTGQPIPLRRDEVR